MLLTVGRFGSAGKRPVRRRDGAANDANGLDWRQRLNRVNASTDEAGKELPIAWESSLLPPQMFRELYLPRWLVLYGVCVPLALVLGYLLATPWAFTSYATVGLVLCVLSIPLLLRWHFALLIASWNAAILFPFLPGQPYIWTVAAVGSLALTLLQRIMDRQYQPVSVPSVAPPLILLGIWVTITAFVTGGFGGRALGEELWGGKKYLGVLGAAVGFFALTAHRIPAEKARRYSSLFFLSGLTLALSDLVYMAGPAFYGLYWFLPAEMAGSQAVSTEQLWRLGGIGFAAQYLVWFLMARFGIRGLFDLTRPWRMLALGGAFGLALLGGFRSTLILLGMLWVVQFYLEGMFRTRLAFVFSLAVALVGVITVTFADRLPIPIQRSLSFLPIPNLDRKAKLDAQGTLDWRIQIWKTVAPEVPRYLLFGKSFAYNGTDYYLTTEAIGRGFAYTVDEATLISGNYHQGILTVIIPFGIWGLLLFGWFCWSSLKILLRHRRNGKESLRLTNTFILAMFVTRLFFYIFLYGQFELDLPVLVGLIGLSVALNGGVANPRKATVEPSAPA